VQIRVNVRLSMTVRPGDRANSDPTVGPRDTVFIKGLTKNDKTDNGTDDGSIISLNWAVVHGPVVDVPVLRAR